MHTWLLAIGGLAFLGSLAPVAAQQCPSNPDFVDAGAAWNGWGVDISNSRYQTATAAQMTASQVPGLKLKWAFGLAGAKQVFGEPSVAFGRVFVSADTGMVYALNADTGCLYWT